MDKNLFRVKVVLYVMAENESAARMAATQAPFDIFECTAKKATRIEPAWNDAVPYNSEDTRTCAEIFTDPPKVSQPSTRLEHWHPGIHRNAKPSAAHISPR